MHKLKQVGRQTFSSLAIKNYRLYFIGQTISMCGTWMQIVAQGFLVLKLGGSGTALGILMAFHFLPILLIGAYGGVVADRFSKRRIIVITQTFACLFALTVGILLLLNRIELWMVYVIAALHGIVNAFDSPARQTFIMEMVGSEQVKNAVSLNSILSNSARVVGPAIAGLFISTIGLAACFVLNGLSYLAVVIAMFFMNRETLETTQRTKQIKGRLQEGFMYVKQTPAIWSTLVIAALIGTFSFEFMVTLPLLAEFTFLDKTANSYAALTSAMGLGAIFGAIYSASKKHIATKFLVKHCFLFGIAMLCSASMPNLLLAILAMIVVGFFSMTTLVLLNTTLQLTSAPVMRGRVMALYTIAIFGSTPIGAPFVGWLGDVAGARWAIASGGFAAVLAAGFGVLFIKKSRAKREELPQVPQAAFSPDTSEKT